MAMVVLIVLIVCDPFGPIVDSFPTPTPTVSPTAPPEGDIVIPMASSITKRDWNANAIEVFNARSQSDPSFQVDGRPIRVEIILEPSPLNPEIRRYYRSPTQVEDTLNHKIKPVILSPANSTWISKPESTEGGGRVSALKRQEGAPVLLG